MNEKSTENIKQEDTFDVITSQDEKIKELIIIKTELEKVSMIFF